MLLDNKVVLITGGSRGIGAAVARGFLACGADVFAHVGRTEEYVARDLTPGLTAEALGRLRVLTADLSVPGGGEGLASAVLAAAAPKGQRQSRERDDAGI